MPHDLSDDPTIENPEILSWKDIFFPAIYIILLLILIYFLWQLLNPVIALMIGGIIAYIHYLRDIFRKE